MRLNDPLVTSFDFEGVEYTIDLAFDNVLDTYDVFDDKDLRDYEKAEISLALLLDRPCQVAEAIDIWNHIYYTFIHVESERAIEYDRKGNPLIVQKEQRKTIDFNKDADYIFASFQEAYNINLFREQGILHWHEFKALVNGLPSDTVMQRIIQIRLWEPSKGDSQEYKQAMQERQKAYALEDVEEVE